jgi:hypothetical protein
VNGVELTRQEAPQVSKAIISHGATIQNFEKADNKVIGAYKYLKIGLVFAYILAYQAETFGF